MMNVSNWLTYLWTKNACCADIQAITLDWPRPPPTPPHSEQMFSSETGPYLRSTLSEPPRSESVHWLLLWCDYSKRKADTTHTQSNLIDWKKSFRAATSNIRVPGGILQQRKEDYCTDAIRPADKIKTWTVGKSTASKLSILTVMTALGYIKEKPKETHMILRTWSHYGLKGRMCAD